MIEEELQKALRLAITPGMTAKACAKAVEKVLRKAAEQDGQTPNIEVFSAGPEARHFAGKCWVACWEAGPYDWGITASCGLSEAGKRLVETYYGFDVCFYDEE